MLAAELGESGRLRGATTACCETSVCLGVSIPIVERGFGNGVSNTESGESTSRTGTTDSFVGRDVLVGKELDVGVGETVVGKGLDTGFSGGGVVSAGEGKACTTLSSNLFVRTPAD